MFLQFTNLQCTHMKFTPIHVGTYICTASAHHTVHASVCRLRNKSRNNYNKLMVDTIKSLFICLKVCRVHVTCILIVALNLYTHTNTKKYYLLRLGADCLLGTLELAPQVDQLFCWFHAPPETVLDEILTNLLYCCIILLLMRESTYLFHQNVQC